MKLYWALITLAAFVLFTLGISLRSRRRPPKEIKWEEEHIGVLRKVEYFTYPVDCTAIELLRGNGTRCAYLPGLWEVSFQPGTPIRILKSSDGRYRTEELPKQ